MPGVCRYGLNKLKEHLEVQVRKGLQSVLLFGVVENLPKANYHCIVDNIIKYVNYRMMSVVMLRVEKIQ